MSEPQHHVPVVKHRHVEGFGTPKRCAECGELWKHVMDGRLGRARRKHQMTLFEEYDREPAPYADRGEGW